MRRDTVTKRRINVDVSTELYLVIKDVHFYGDKGGSLTEPPGTAAQSGTTR